METYQKYMKHVHSNFNFRDFDKIPKSRYETISYCFNHISKMAQPLIVELGTSRSFVDGCYKGCNEDDSTYWEPNNPQKWDWGAGVFSLLVPRCLNIPYIFHSVDISSAHINRSRIMNKDYSIHYHISSSEDFLNIFNNKIDLLYMDTGDMIPIEDSAQLHLREAHIIVERDLISPHGLILIDDVMSPVPLEYGEKSKLGKGKYSIPYLLEHGFETVMDEYQYVLAKNKTPSL